MIIKSSKIKLIKSMGMFNKIGEVCEIINISDDAVITFKCSFGIGCMSYDELNKYFEICDDTTTKQDTKRTWTEWFEATMIIPISECVFNFPIKIRDNGKIVEFRTNWDVEKTNLKNLKVRSFCNLHYDDFSLVKGFRICRTRLIIKLYELALAIAINDSDPKKYFSDYIM